MTALERAIVTQQGALNRGECLNRGINDSVIAQTLPPFETYLRQLDIAAALCFSGNDTGPDLDHARRLADELVAYASGDPWALLVDAQVDEQRMANTSAIAKRRRVVERWRDADDNLPLVRAVRELVQQPPSTRAPTPSTAPDPEVP
jgi:hypothetical protein